MIKVLAMGCFDLFHVGHLNYLKTAKNMGDYLIVGVASDSYIKLTKAETIISQSNRRAIIDALAIVDETVILPFPMADTTNASEWIKSLDINIVASGDEWQNSTKWNNLITALVPHDIAVAFIPKTKGISSTQIKEKIVTLRDHCTVRSTNSTYFRALKALFS